jgi:hypothetical protein
VLLRFGKAPVGEPAVPGTGLGLVTVVLGVVLPSTEVPSGSWLVPPIEPHGRPSASVRPMFSVPGVEGLVWSVPGPDGLPPKVPGVEGFGWSVPGADGLPPKVPGVDGLVWTAPGADGLPPNVPGVDGLVWTAPGADGFPPKVPGVEGLVWTAPGAGGLVPKVPGADGDGLVGEGAAPGLLMPDDAPAPPPVLPAPPLWPSARPELPARRIAASMDKDCRVCGIANSCEHHLPGNGAGRAMFLEPPLLAAGWRAVQ